MFVELNTVLLILVWVAIVAVYWRQALLLKRTHTMLTEKPFTTKDLERFIGHLEILLKEKERAHRKELLKKLLNPPSNSTIDVEELGLDPKQGLYVSPELEESITNEKVYWQIEFSGEGERLEGEGPNGEYTDDQRKAYDKDPNVFYCTFKEALRIAKDRHDGGLRE
jgi:hypothetical protein